MVFLKDRYSVHFCFCYTGCEMWLFLYADDTCLTFQHENIKEIEDQWNLNFSSLGDWLIGNKLSIRLNKDKTKSILFGTKFNIKRAGPLNTVYGNVKIKQYSKVTYQGSFLMNHCQENRWHCMFLIKSALDIDFSIDKIDS